MEFRCENPGRRQKLLDQSGNPATWINAIDYVVVHDPSDQPNLRQRVLALRFLFANGLASLTANNFALRGGVRVVDPSIRWARQATTLASPGGPLASPGDTSLGLADRSYLANLAASLPNPSEWVLLLTAQRGDFSRYTLILQDAPGALHPPTGFDRRLDRIELSVKVDCPNDFDCASEPPLPAPATEPELDYLARDFSSFKRLLFDRLALLQPNAPKREPALFQTALVELLAAAADELAYFQDAVATEAHLASARLRTSVRRHARLLDYRIHEGCNARAFVHFEIAANQVFVAAPNTALLEAGTRLLSAVPDTPALVRPESLTEVLASGPELFELMLPVRTLSHAHDAITLHTWGDDDCCLPVGATAVALVDGDLLLAVGDFLLFEEICDPDTGVVADADPTRRHIVRLTAVTSSSDDLLGVDVVEVEWSSDDAMPFALPIKRGGRASVVARANLALVDHGRRFVSEDLVQIPYGVDGRARVELPERELCHRDWEWINETERGTLAASRLVRQDPRNARARIEVEDEGEGSWTTTRSGDLLASDPSAREFVVETENDGRVWLRFGDGVKGRRPGPDTRFVARYWIGHGTRGNVGAEAIAHLVGDPPIAAALAASIRKVRNPLAASGGMAPEPISEVKLHAPRAFLRQERAVTLEDWAEVAGRHPEVQRAVATMRWTGSWNTIYLAIDRVGGSAVDAAFETELLAYLERYRLAGYDVEITGPRWVPLDIAMTICVDPRHRRAAVESELLASFGIGQLRDGSRGFFHPDAFTFGQSVHLSHVVARAAQVEGVRWVDVTARQLPSDNDNRFQRWGFAAAGELDAGVITIGRQEIARCDNDRNLPDRGRIRFFMEGGA